MSVHFEYQGKHFELPDGTTPEQAKAKITAHLGIKQEQPKQQHKRRVKPTSFKTLLLV